MVKKTRTTLSNGLGLVVIEISDSKSLITSFWTKAGSRLDPKGKPGLAHFVEHLMVKKTKTYPSDILLSQELEKYGAYKNAQTSKDSMSFDIASSNENSDLSLRIMADMIFNTYIDEDGFKKERKTIFQEQARKRSMPDLLIWEVWYRAFFGPGKMIQTQLGDKDSLNKITLKDVLEFKENNLLSKSNLLLVSGGVKTESTIDLAEKYFGKYELKDPNKIPTFKYNTARKIEIEKRDLPRTNMIMTFRIPGGEVYKDYYSLLLLRCILTLGWSSRLMQRLRVKESLVYGMQSNLDRLIDTGAFSFALASEKSSFSRMISVLCQELVKAREGFTQEEVELAKGFIRGRVLSSVETSRDYESWYAENELFWPDNVDSIEERLEKIGKVTKEEVEIAARKYLTNDNWSLAVVGDIKEEDIKVNL